LKKLGDFLVDKKKLIAYLEIISKATSKYREEHLGELPSIKDLSKILGIKGYKLGDWINKLERHGYLKTIRMIRNRHKVRLIDFISGVNYEGS
jgi:DNA-binding MarR family transcriptional regulator